MRGSILAVAAAALALACAAVQAQTAFTVPPAPSSVQTAPGFAAADAIALKMWFNMQKNLPAVPLTSLTSNLEDGAILPPVGVIITPVPADAGVPSATKYSYAKVGDRIVLVDPATRKIVYQIS